MDELILQKEPGYEGYDKNYEENEIYSLVVKYGNMAYAMLATLKNPPIEFYDVIIKHFSFKKSIIIDTCEKWVEESKKRDSIPSSEYRLVEAHNGPTIRLFNEKGIYNAFNEVFQKLKYELENLPVYN